MVPCVGLVHVCGMLACTRVSKGRISHLGLWVNNGHANYHKGALAYVRGDNKWSITLCLVLAVTRSD